MTPFARRWLTGAWLLIVVGAGGTLLRWPVAAAVVWLVISTLWACVGFIWGMRL
jgi:hypothetical protein